VLFLADGRAVDEMRQPTAESVLERMKRFDVLRVTADDSGGPVP
jgi:putative ABC transport system ATP-binding protein